MRAKYLGNSTYSFPFFIIFVVAVVLGCVSTSHKKNSSGDENTLRIFVYNIQHGQGLDGKVDLKRIADLIGKKDPHLVALNEVDVDVERSGNVDIMAKLAEFLDMEPVFGKNISLQGGEYGNGILTTLPLVSSKNFHFEMPEEGEQRGLLQTVVDFEGHKVVFMTTHLDHQSEKNREVAVKRIIETLESYSGSPVIIAGDFNSTPGERIVRQMNSHFTDVWKEKGVGSGYTIPAPESLADRRIDYVFYSNNGATDISISPVEISVINSSASDHLPVFSKFKTIRK